MRLFIILGLVFMLTLVGCSTSADQNQFDYIPYSGQGCAFSVVDNTQEDVVQSERLVHSNELVLQSFAV